MRAVDVPKFRRVKNRGARLGDSVYFSSNGLIYAKLLLLWFSCILLDLLIGFRFELLWPLWLMIRHLYDVFRVQTFVSSFHYSAFSVFFVCITATSDLICYLFIPVQVLMFIASTYVWIQFVYQSNDRGFCTPSFLLWGLFVGFEYLVRCRFDQSTLYLTRSSWITAGMFSTGTESIMLGNAADASSRFEIYKPFAAHCLGYPIVTLGFRVKSFFSSWRLKRRRLEVMKQNDVYYRLLAEALPAPYEGRFIASHKQLALENGEFELDDELQSESGAVITSQPTSYAAGALGAGGAAIGAAGGGGSSSTAAALPPSTNPIGSRKSRAPTISAASKTHSSTNLTHRLFWFIRLFGQVGYELVFSPLWRFEAGGNAADSSLLDDESDREDAKGDAATTAKRKSKRTRGRTPAVGVEPLGNPTATPPAAKPPKGEANGNLSANRDESPALSNAEATRSERDESADGGEWTRNGTPQMNGRLREKERAKLHEKCTAQVAKLEAKIQTERESSPDLDLLRNQESAQRTELAQIRQRLNDADQRAETANRTADRLKREIAAQAKRTTAAEPAAKNRRGEEARSAAGTPDQTALQREVEQLRAKIQTMESELSRSRVMANKLEREMKSTSDAAKCAKNFKEKAANGELAEQLKAALNKVADMQQANARLEKTLMAENRLKVDLFRALNESKAQVEMLSAQLRQLGDSNALGLSGDFESPPLPSSLVASLANGFGSNSSSPATVGGTQSPPSSSSPHSIGGVQSKSSTSLTEELDAFFQSNGGHWGLGSFPHEHDSFSRNATPSTNAAAQALASQLKAAHGSRSNSPTSTELFFINGGSNGATSGTSKSNPLDFGFVGAPKMNVSPSFH
ncbi:Macoilin-2 [Aphelenchoides fujianensis]|nr:Macoilin-2 [Aphelenchoides fujianensis]